MLKSLLVLAPRDWSVALIDVWSCAEVRLTITARPANGFPCSCTRPFRLFVARASAGIRHDCVCLNFRRTEAFWLPRVCGPLSFLLNSTGSPAEIGRRPKGDEKLAPSNEASISRQRREVQLETGVRFHSRAGAGRLRNPQPSAVGGNRDRVADYKSMI